MVGHAKGFGPHDYESGVQREVAGRDGCCLSAVNGKDLASKAPLERDVSILGPQGATSVSADAPEAARSANNSPQVALGAPWTAPPQTGRGIRSASGRHSSAVPRVPSPFERKLEQPASDPTPSERHLTRHPRVRRCSDGHWLQIRPLPRCSEGGRE